MAILCFGKVVATQPITAVQSQNNEHNISAESAAKPSDAQWQADVEFSQILEADVEQLVKASLNVQQKQLKLRKLSRDER